MRTKAHSRASLRPTTSPIRGKAFAKLRETTESRYGDLLTRAGAAAWALAVGVPIRKGRILFRLVTIFVPFVAAFMDFFFVIHLRSRVMLCPHIHLKHLILKRGSLNGQEIKAPRMDESRCSNAEGTRKKENTRLKHRSGFKAHGKFNATESFQYGIVA